jgi:hypothetical protein
MSPDGSPPTVGKRRAVGGLGVILLEIALQISGFQSPALAALLVLIGLALLWPLLNEWRKIAANAGKRLYGRYGSRNPMASMIVVIVIGMLLGGSVFGGAAWLFKRAYDKNPNVVAEPKEPAFVVHMGWSSYTTTPTFWFVAGQKTAIWGRQLITFTHKKSHPILIESYKIEQQLPDGSWESISLPYDVTRGKLYLGGADTKDAIEIQHTSFDEVIQNKNISHNESVRGWLFFVRERKGKLRMTIDTPEGSYTELMMGSVSKGWPIQSSMNEPVPGAPRIDLGKIEISQMSNFPPAATPTIPQGPIERKTETDPHARKQIKELKERLADADPLSQPIASAEVTVMLKLSEPSNGRGGISNLAVELIEERTLSSGSGKQSETLLSFEGHQYNGIGNELYAQGGMRPNSRLAGKTIRSLKAATVLQFRILPELLNQASGGSVTIVLNGSISLTFPIPPETASHPIAEGVYRIYDVNETLRALDARQP